MTTPLQPLTLSASAVRDYRQCAYRFARGYLVLLDPRERRRVRALGFGEVVHATIADFFKYGAWNAVGLDDLEVLLRVHWRPGLYADQDLADANFERAREMLMRFFEARYPRDVVRELGIERRHAWRRFHHGLLAVGRIDYACLLADGTLLLVDWKTARRTGGVEDLAQDEQALFIRSLGGEQYQALAPRRILVTFFYLPTGLPVTVEFEHEDFERGWKRIEAIALAIRQAIASVIDGASMLEAFPPRRGVHCALCPVGAHCDALAAAGKLVVPPEGGAA